MVCEGEFLIKRYWVGVVVRGDEEWFLDCILELGFYVLDCE